MIKYDRKNENKTVITFIKHFKMHTKQKTNDENDKKLMITKMSRKSPTTALSWMFDNHFRAHEEK